MVSRDDGTPIDDADLFTLAHGRGDRSLWERLRESSDPRLASAKAFLECWLAEGAGLSPFAFFSRLLVESRGALLRRLGPEANDPLDALLDIALEFEHDHAPTLSAFLAWFAGTDIEIKRDMDQGSDEVRVMTVHGAKGLESHIVILPDTVDMPDNRRRSPVIMVKPDADGPDIPLWVLSKTARSPMVQAWCDAKLDSVGDEYRRLLYVAMTRARDELYVCGWHNRSEPKPECWYELMNGRHHRTSIGGGRSGWRYSHGGWAAPTSGPTRPHRSSLPTSPPPPGSRQRIPNPRSQTRILRNGFGSPASARRETRMERGRFLHKLLQRLPELPEEARTATAALLAKREGFAEAIAASAVTLIADPRYSGSFASAGLAEVPVRHEGRRMVGMIAGQIDRLIGHRGRSSDPRLQDRCAAGRQRRDRRPDLSRPTRGLPRGGQIGVSRDAESARRCFGRRPQASWNCRRPSSTRQPCRKA